MSQLRNKHKIVLWKLECKSQLWRSRSRMYDNNKTDLRLDVQNGLIWLRIWITKWAFRLEKFCVNFWTSCLLSAFPGWVWSLELISYSFCLNNWGNSCKYMSHSLISWLGYRTVASGLRTRCFPAEFVYCFTEFPFSDRAYERFVAIRLSLNFIIRC
jgi:hypothetical protein